MPEVYGRSASRPQVSRSHAAVVPRTGVIPCASAVCETRATLPCGACRPCRCAPRLFRAAARRVCCRQVRSDGPKRLRPADSPVGRALASALEPCHPACPPLFHTQALLRAVTLVSSVARLGRSGPPQLCTLELQPKPPPWRRGERFHHLGRRTSERAGDTDFARARTA